MSIHDNARQAFEAVYDTEFARFSAELATASADLTEAVEARDAAVLLYTEEQTLRRNAEQISRTLTADLAKSNTDLSAVRAELSAANKKIAELEARIRQLETTAPPAVSYGPVRFSSVEEAVEKMNLDPTANYVLWKAEWENLTITEVSFFIGANDVIVLPERDDPYLIDLTNGFMAAGISELINGGVKDSARRYVSGGTRYPVANKYKGRNANTWFAAVRLTRGLLGLGPKAVVSYTSTSWRMPQQIRTNANAGTGQPGTGQFHVSTSGAISTEKIGAQEKMIESSTAKAIFANFVMEEAPDLGGVCFGGIATSKEAPTFVNLDIRGAWRSAGVSPNIETPGLAMGSSGYRIENCILDGKLHGSTPIMVNQGGINNLGGTVKNTIIRNGIDRSGPAAMYQVSGTHTWENVIVDNIGGPNVEDALDGFSFVVKNSDWSKMRADRHISLGYPRTKVSISVSDTPLSPASNGVLGVNRWANGGTRGNLDNSGITHTLNGVAQPINIRQ